MEVFFPLGSSWPSDLALLFITREQEKISIFYSVGGLVQVCFAVLRLQREVVEQLYRFRSLLYTIPAKNWQIRSCLHF